MKKTEYHSSDSCNCCGSDDVEHINPSYEGALLLETKTKCNQCGFDDYWVMGFYESSQEGFDCCKKYYN